MGIVDREGRLFGRINVLDAAVVVVLLAAGALTVVGYKLLRVPTPPQIAKVVPETLTAGPKLRITIAGENILPYLRVYIQRTSQPPQVMHDFRASMSYDSYVLANTAQAALLVESPRLAEVRLPEELMPGTYDLILFNETKIVHVRPAAFTIVPAAVPRKVSSEPQGAVRVSGAFTGLPDEASAAIVVGMNLPQGAAEPWGEILSVKPRAPDSGRLNFETGKLVVQMRNRWQVPAVLRIVCMVGQFKCWLPNAVVVAPGANLSIAVAGGTVNFAVADVTADPPEPLTTVSMTVRFVARPEIAALPREHDADTSPGGDRARPARLASIQRRGEMTGTFAESLHDGSIQVAEPVTVLECTVSAPVTATETGWQYRSQPIKAGAPITFQTDRYIMRGTIRSVARPGPDAAAAR